MISGIPIPTLLAWASETGIKKRVAAVVKPCEARAIVELAKFKQVDIDKVLIVSCDCIGTFHVLKYKEMLERGESPLDKALNAVKTLDFSEFRDACKACLTVKPPTYDLNLAFIGEVRVEAGSKAGVEALRKTGLNPVNIEERPIIREITELKRKNREELKALTEKEVCGVKKLNEFFKDCISCHNCMETCPICYCKECFLDSERYDYMAKAFFSWQYGEGLKPLLENKVQFHIGRAIHMSTSCVTCGLCEQACPQEVKLARFFMLLADSNQSLFNYYPGRRLDEKPPVQEFKPEELAEFVG